jgi:hypothetical protein
MKDNIELMDPYFFSPMQKMSLQCLKKNVPCGSQLRIKPGFDSVEIPDGILTVRDHKVARYSVQSAWFTVVDVGSEDSPVWVDNHFFLPS